MRPVLLGMAPGKIGDFEDLDPSLGSGKRLLEMIGEDIFLRFDRRNVIRHKLWRKMDARTRRSEVRREMAGRIVVVLGNETWTCLGLPKATAFGKVMTKIAGETPTEWWRVPHPSGRNRLYNDEAMREKMRALLTRLSETKTNVREDCSQCD